jgi:hypothetical protein
MTTLPVAFVPGAAGVVVENERPPASSRRRMHQAYDRTVLSPSEWGG